MAIRILIRVFLFLNCFIIFKAQQKPKITIFEEKKDQEYFLYAKNEEPITGSLKLILNLENMSTDISNRIILIPAKSDKFLLGKISTKDRSKSIRFSYISKYILGNAEYDIKANEDIIYSLPFPKNKEYTIDQGYNGHLTHQNINALDFNLKQEDEICAARDGYIMEVVDNHTQHCPDPSCEKFNNKIIIAHQDGSFAIYAHIKYKGAVVNIGQLIKQGEIIGYSGNTGWATGDHLHFSVYYNKINGEPVFLKTKFLTSGNKEPIYLEEGRLYKK